MGGPVVMATMNVRVLHKAADSEHDKNTEPDLEQLKRSDEGL